MYVVGSDYKSEADLMSVRNTTVLQQNKNQKMSEWHISPPWKLSPKHQGQ